VNTAHCTEYVDCRIASNLPNEIGNVWVRNHLQISGDSNSLRDLHPKPGRKIVGSSIKGDGAHNHDFVGTASLDPRLKLRFEKGDDLSSLSLSGADPVVDRGVPLWLEQIEKGRDVPFRYHQTVQMRDWVVVADRIRKGIRVDDEVGCKVAKTQPNCRALIPSRIADNERDAFLGMRRSNRQKHQCQNCS
jgi:hypothetical protein